MSAPSGPTLAGATPAGAMPARPLPATIVFTAVELAALLGLRPGPAAEVSREWLALTDTGPDAVRAGTISLRHRGYLPAGATALAEAGGPADAVAEAGGPADAVAAAAAGVPSAATGDAGPAAVVGHALTVGGTWTAVVLADRDAVTPCLILDADPVHLWIAPYPDRSFAVTALRARYPRAELCESLAGYLGSTVPCLVSVDVRAGGDRAGVIVSRSPDGRWWVQRDGGEAVGEAVACPRADAMAAVASAVQS